MQQLQLLEVVTLVAVAVAASELAVQLQSQELLADQES
jgi:hypothetical protein